MEIVPTIVQTVDKKVNETFYEIQTQLGITDGGVPPELAFRLDSAKEEMIETILEIIKAQLGSQGDQ